MDFKAPRGYSFTATVENLTLTTDLSDIFNMESTDSDIGAEITEVRVWQRGVITAGLDTLRFKRGVITSPAGTAVTEREWDVTGKDPTYVVRSLATTDVASDDLRIRVQWNLLSESVWLPTPDQKIVLKPGDDFGVNKTTSTAHTGVGFCVTWREYGL